MTGYPRAPSASEPKLTKWSSIQVDKTRRVRGRVPDVVTAGGNNVHMQHALGCA